MTLKEKLEALSDSLHGQADSTLAYYVIEGARSVQHLIPESLMYLFTGEASVPNDGIEIGPKFTYVLREDIECRQIPARKRLLASKAGSIHQATSDDPVYYLRNGKLYILPVDGATRTVDKVLEPVVTDINVQEAITNFDNSVESIALKIGASMVLRKVSREMQSKSLTEYDGIKTLLSALTAQIDAITLTSVSSIALPTLGVLETISDPNSLAITLTKETLPAIQTVSALERASHSLSMGNLNVVATKPTGPLPTRIAETNFASINVPNAPTMPWGAITIPSKPSTFTVSAAPAEPAYTFGTTIPSSAPTRDYTGEPSAPSAPTHSYAGAPTAPTKPTRDYTDDPDAPGIPEYFNFSTDVNGVRTLNISAPDVLADAEGKVTLPQTSPAFDGSGISKNTTGENTYLTDDYSPSDADFSEVLKALTHAEKFIGSLDDDGSLSAGDSPTGTDDVPLATASGDTDGKALGSWWLADEDPEMVNSAAQLSGKALERAQVHIQRLLREVETKLPAISERLKEYQVDVQSAIQKFQGEVEAYKAGIEGQVSKSQTEIQKHRAEVENYRSQIEELLSIFRAEAQLYQAQIGAFNSKNEYKIQKGQLEASDFGTEAQVFGQGVQQSLGKENIISQDYQANVQKYQSETAYRLQKEKIKSEDAQLETQQANIASTFEIAKSDFEAKKGQHNLQAYQAKGQLDAQKAGADSQIYRTEVEAYRATVDEEFKKHQHELEEYRAKLQQEDFDLRQLSTEAQDKVATFRANVEEYIAEANVYRTLVEAQLAEYAQEVNAYQAQLGTYQAEIQEYRSYVEYIASQNQIAMQHYQAAVQQNLNDAQIKLQEYETFEALKTNKDIQQMVSHNQSKIQEFSQKVQSAVAEYNGQLQEKATEFQGAFQKVQTGLGKIQTHMQATQVVAYDNKSQIATQEANLLYQQGMQELQMFIQANTNIEMEMAS